MTRDGLAAALAAIGIPERQINMRATQIWHWIYLRGATDFSEMTNVSRDLRAALAAAYALTRPEIVTEQVSSDGTRLAAESAACGGVWPSAPTGPVTPRRSTAPWPLLPLRPSTSRYFQWLEKCDRSW